MENIQNILVLQRAQEAKCRLGLACLQICKMAKLRHSVGLFSVFPMCAIFNTSTLCQLPLNGLASWCHSSHIHSFLNEAELAQVQVIFLQILFVTIHREISFFHELQANFLIFLISFLSLCFLVTIQTQRNTKIQYRLTQPNVHIICNYYILFYLLYIIIKIV